MLSVTASPSASFPDGVPVTLEALRKAASPSVAIAGTVGTSDLDAEAATPAKLKASAAYNYAAGVLGAGVYAVTLSPAATSYVTGMEVKFRADVANTGAVDLNVNGLGAKNLFKLGGEELEAGDIRAGMDVVAIYDSTAPGQFQVVSAGGNRPVYVVPAADVAGTANAITLTLRPTPASLANLVGLAIVFLAEADITVGGVTLNVNGLGAKNVYKNFSTALALNDIRNGQLVEVRYDGTQFQLISSVASRTDVPAIRGSYRGLALSPDGTYPDHVVTGSVKEVVLEDASGNVVVFRAQSITCDVTLSQQVNGRDHTAAEAASTWYHLWAISDGTQWGTVLSLSSSAPAVAGWAAAWVYYAYLGAVYNDAGSNFVSFTQIDDTVQIAETVTGVVPNTTAGTANVWNGPLSLGAVIPPTAQRVLGNMGTGGASALAVVAVSPYGSTVGIRQFSAATSGVLFNSFYVSAPYEVMVGPTQGFYWMSGNTTSQNRISITGWKYSRPYGG